MSDHGVEPVYEKIEFCRDPETLWGKLQSGRWDWLGVHPRGQFVLGSPRRSGGSTMLAAAHISKEGATSGEHGVYVRTPLGPGPSANWYATEQQAREEFQRTVETLQANERSPGLFKVQRVENKLIVDEVLVVRRPPTYR